MATEDIAGRELSGDEFEYKCTAGCLKKNQVKEAVKACIDCKKYFCSSCIEVHNSILDSHDLVPPPELFSQTPTTLPVDQCKIHLGQTIDVWCVHHDAVCCADCAFDKHRSCEDIKDIQSDINEIFKQNEFDLVINELSKSSEYLKCRNNFLAGEKESLFIEMKVELSKAEEYARKLISNIKTLFKKVQDEIRAKFKHIEDKIQKVAKHCECYEENIRQCLELLDSSTGNTSKMFITMKNAQQIIALVDKNCRKPTVGNCTVVFKSDSTFEQYQSGFDILGTSSIVPRKFELGHKQEINIKTSDDSTTCNIEGSCLLQDGSVVVTDYSNQKLKILDILSSSVTDSCKVPGEPFGVCIVSQQKLAVALRKNKIQFVNLRTRLTLSKTISVYHECYGIAYHNKELFVSDRNKKIYVYNLQGSLLRSLDILTTSYIRHLTVSRDGKNIFISSSWGGLVCIDQSGRPVFTYTNKNKYVYGVCLGNRSSLFVCGHHNVLQVSDSGKKMGEIVNRTDGLNYPQSICFDICRQRLVVTQWSNTVLVFELKLPD